MFLLGIFLCLNRIDTKVLHSLQEGGIFMILSGDSIKKELREGRLVRCDDKTTLDLLLSHVGPNSLDVRLGDTFKVLEIPSDGVIDIHEKQRYKTIPLDSKGSFILEANGFCLATTVEYLCLPNDVCALIDGRSTTGRMGLVVETAGMINAGYHGAITLELKNLTNYPIRMYPGDCVSQIRFERLDQAASEPYRGVYYQQEGTTEPASLTQGF